MSTDFDWSTVSDDRLRDLAKEYSASKIALQLGCSRNAVIGRCLRRKIDLCSRPPKVAESAPAAPKRPPIQRQTYAVKAQKLAIVEPVEIVGEHLSLTIMQLRSDSCRWPLWKGNVPFADKRYCGAKAAVGEPYCAQCQRLSYSPRRTESVDRKLGFFRLQRAA